MNKIVAAFTVWFFMSSFGSSDAAQTIRGVNLLRFESSLPWAAWDAQLTSSAGNIGISDFTIVEETTLDDSAEITIETWIAQTAEAGNFIVFSHGSGDAAFSIDPGVQAEVYSTESARNTRYDTLVANGSSVVKSRNETGTQFAIYVLAEEMPGVLGTAGLADSPVVLGIYCNSEDTHDRWQWALGMPPFLDMAVQWRPVRR